MSYWNRLMNRTRLDERKDTEQMDGLELGPAN